MVFYHSAVFHISFHCTNNNFRLKTKKLFSTSCNTFMYILSNACICTWHKVKTTGPTSSHKSSTFLQTDKICTHPSEFFYSALQCRNANCIHILPKILVSGIFFRGVIQGLIQTNPIELIKPEGARILHSIATPSEQKCEFLVQAYCLL